MTGTTDRQIKLGYHLGPLHDWAQREDGTTAPYGAAALVQTAKKAEAALIDALFRADGFGFPPERAANFQYGALDPLLAFASVATSTERIGLVGTVSTTFNHPYITARQVLSLDHLSGGRAGWNAVTSFGGERAFNADPIPDQTERYRRAHEFLQVVQGLWSTWADDALVLDAERHLFAQPDRIRPFSFRGEYFDIEAVSQLPPSAQGRPVQFQAGASAEGKRFAARHAEAVFSASPDIEHARAIYAEFKSLALAAGRDPARLLVLPGASFVLAPTEREAQERYRSFADDLDFEAGRAGTERYLGDVDLSSVALDEPVPPSLLPADTAVLTRRRSRAELLKRIALQPGNTLRDVIRSFLLTDGGHFLTAQSYDGAARVLEERFTTGAADGFVLGFRGGAEQFDAFIEHVIPRLQDRGQFRRKYEGDTLRENLGLTL